MKTKAFESLYDFLVGQDHYLDNSSNFATYISIISKMNDIEGTTYIIKQPTASSQDGDWPFLLRKHSLIPYIENINKARNIFFNDLSKQDRDNLYLIFYESPNKFSFKTRNICKFVYEDYYIDLSALVFSISKHNTIRDFESQTDKNIKEKLRLAQHIFIDVVNKYLKLYGEKYDSKRNDSKRTKRRS